MTKEDYLARVPDIDERENAARLFEAMKAAEVEYRNTPEPGLTDEQNAELNALIEEYSKRRQAVYDWYDAERARVWGSTQNAHLEQAQEAATTAYENAPGDPIAEGDDESIALRCALSGAPIYETDATVEIGGKAILACVLLTPEQIEALTAGDDDEIEEAA